jgi:hypothetical protein
MTVAKGQPWGAAVPADRLRPVMSDDAALHRWVNQHRLAGTPIPPVTLTGGDLARTCGGGHTGTVGATVTRVTLDIVRIDGDVAPVWMVAHMVARRSWWSGPVVLAMNAQFLGRYDVAPRSHPNDGKVDVLQVADTMSARVRWQARQRAVQGTHLPHPQLAMRQSAALTIELSRAVSLRVDGVSVGASRAFTLTVEPDAVVADIA